MDVEEPAVDDQVDVVTAELVAEYLAQSPTRVPVDAHPCHGWSMARAHRETGSLEVTLSDIATRAATGHDGVDVDWLMGYVSAVATVLRAGGDLDAVERARCSATGGLAAAAGVGLPSVVDAFLTATRLLWDELPTLHASPPTPLTVERVLELGRQSLRAADDALAAVAEGYARARRAVVRQEETLRRQFIEDVLGGGADVADLVMRAERYGLQLTAPHTVVVASSASPLRGEGLSVAGMEEQLRSRLPGRDLLVTVREACIVAIVGTRGPGAGSPPPQELGDLIAELTTTALRGQRPARVALGREHEGPAGIGMSYREASDTLGLAAELAWPHQVVATEELAVYRVLLRDSQALSVLVHSVLAPLTIARGGAEPLIDTLATFLASGGVVTETARRMHLSPRAVTYRLSRIHTLTGHDPTNPADWLTLHIAAVGARLLNWPDAGAPARASLPTLGNKQP